MRSGAVLGYRGWRLQGFAPGQVWLHGPISRVRWPEDGPLHAYCKPLGLQRPGGKNPPRKELPHDTPDRECICGIYGFHGLTDAVASYGINRAAVVGPALFWGNIELHTAGFKAEFARPLAICEDYKSYDERFGENVISGNLVEEWEEMLESIQARYSIPLLPMDLVEQYALTWASPIGIEYDTEQ